MPNRYAVRWVTVAKYSGAFALLLTIRDIVAPSEAWMQWYAGFAFLTIACLGAVFLRSMLTVEVTVQAIGKGRRVLAWRQISEARVTNQWGGLGRGISLQGDSAKGVFVHMDIVRDRVFRQALASYVTNPTILSVVENAADETLHST